MQSSSDQVLSDVSTVMSDLSRYLERMYTKPGGDCDDRLIELAQRLKAISEEINENLPGAAPKEGSERTNPTFTLAEVLTVRGIGG